MDNIFLQTEKLSKRFGGVRALVDVDFHIDKGETLCMIGENGSGKSTLIKIISGIYAPDGGRIIVEGRARRRLTPMESIGSGIQVIYQDFSLFHNLSVAENIAINQFLSEKKRLVSHKRSREIAEGALAELGIDLELDREVGELAVAQKQLTAIARALLQDARLIIMDEPTTALTAREVDKLFGVIQTLKKRGCAILFVSHKLDEVKHVSQRVMVLRNGRKTADVRAEDVDTDQMTYYISGKYFTEKRYTYKPDETAKKTALSVKSLCYRDILRDVSFDLDKGEILGITGLLGSGRTELALALFGVIRLDSGRVQVGGETRTLGSVRRALDCSIGYVPEDRLTEGLFLEESIEKNIVIRTVNEQSGPVLSGGKLKETARRVFDELHIKAQGPEVEARTLSGGNQQRVVLGKWLSILLQ